MPIQKIQPPEIPKYPAKINMRPSLNSRNNNFDTSTEEVIRSRNLDGTLRNKLLVLQSIKNQILSQSEEEKSDCQETSGP